MISRQPSFALTVAASPVAIQRLGISALDARPYIGITVALLAVATTASYLQARRAAQTDLMICLRQE